MSDKQEDFTRVFIWVLAIVVLFTIVVALVARSVGLNENSGPMTDADIDERTKPYSSVRIAGETDAAASEPAPAAAPEASPAAAETAAVEATPMEPATTEAAPAAAAIEGQQLYSACAACHSTGAAGAPKLGDVAAWAPRITTGMDSMVSNAINGIGAMPPKGGRMDLSSEQIQAIVEYMVNASQ